jgi:hypothetical protein
VAIPFLERRYQRRAAATTDASRVVPAFADRIACVGFPVARSSVVALDAFTLRKGKTRAHRRVLLREGNGLTALP